MSERKRTTQRNKTFNLSAYTFFFATVHPCSVQRYDELREQTKAKVAFPNRLLRTLDTLTTQAQAATTSSSSSSSASAPSPSSQAR